MALRLRFAGALRRAGGALDVAKEQVLRYDFPAIQFEVTLHAETPGQHRRQRRRVRQAALRESVELGGDPQRADGGTTGVALWEASFVLAEWLSRHGEDAGGLAACQAFQELRRVAGRSLGPWRRWRLRGVELGAGLGLPALVAAKLGADVVATDGDACVMKLLRRNVEENPCGRLRAAALLWGAEEPLEKLAMGPADFVLAADVGGSDRAVAPTQVVYASAKEALNKQLLQTMLKLIHSDSETRPKPCKPFWIHLDALEAQVVLLSNVRRFREQNAGEERFLSQAEPLFWRRTVALEELHQVARAVWSWFSAPQGPPAPRRGRLRHPPALPKTGRAVPQPAGLARQAQGLPPCGEGPRRESQGAKGRGRGVEAAPLLNKAVETVTQMKTKVIEVKMGRALGHSRYLRSFCMSVRCRG